MSDVLSEILSCQGELIEGPHDEAVQKTVASIKAMLGGLQQQQPLQQPQHGESIRGGGGAGGLVANASVPNTARGSQVDGGQADQDMASLYEKLRHLEAENERLKSENRLLAMKLG